MSGVLPSVRLGDAGLGLVDLEEVVVDGSCRDAVINHSSQKCFKGEIIETLPMIA